jgi:PAS domain S-box-containing protein
VPGRILVVEDEPDIRLLLRMVLEGNGYSVVEAADAHRALSSVSDEQPDLVVLDLMLPGLDGWGVLSELQHDLAPEVPVVVVSALSSVRDKLRAFEGGAVDYVAKPFARETIIEAVEGALAPVHDIHARRADQVAWLSELGAQQERARLERVEAVANSELDPVAQLAAFVEGTDDAVIGLSSLGAVTNWNPAAERILGFEAPQAVGRLLWDLVDPDGDELPVLCARVGEGEVVRSLTTSWRRKDGEPVDLGLIATPAIDTDGRVLGISVVARDLTTSRWADTTFRSLLEAAPDAVVIINESGRIQFTNNQTEELFDWQAGDLVGRPVEVLLPDRFRDGHGRHRADYFSRPRVRPMGQGLELFGRRRDGTEFPVEISLSPVETSDGLLISAAVRDVSDRKALEAAHAEAEERFRRAFESAPIGMALLDLDGQWMRVNQSLCQILGYEAGDLVAHPPASIVPPAHLPLWRAAFGRVASGRQPDFRLEQIWEGAAGEVWVHVRGASVLDVGGSPSYVIVQVEDVTARKRAELELERTQAALIMSERLAAIGEMASRVSHELRNPLAAITNALYLLRNDLGSSLTPAVSRRLELIERETAKAADISEDMVAFARPRSPVPVPVDLGTLFAEVIDLVPRPASVQAVVPGESVLVLGDRIQLGEMLTNLVTNAYDAMPGGGVLRLGASVERSGVVISVEDSGIGIAHSVASRIFEPFVTTKSQGTGLGLAIVQRIAESHDGSVAISSEPDQGTRVTITLPTPRGRRVFVVDHELGVRTAMAEVLRRAGYLVAEAEDGDVALHLLSEADTDAVVLDLGVPGRDGLAALAEVGEGPPVVVVTGEALDEDALRSAYGGVAAVLHRPVLEPDLLRGVAQALRFDWPGGAYPTLTSSHG